MDREHWQKLHESAERKYKWAFALCEWVEKNLPMSDPLYQAAGLHLESCIRLRELAEAMRDGKELPRLAQADLVSMSSFVKPWAGGGVVPGKT